MPGSFVKDAYAPIYKNSQWNQEAKDYEINLGVMLYKDPQVIASAQTALVKLTQALNAYYGPKSEEAPQKPDEKQLGEVLSLGEVASKLSGQSMPQAAPQEKKAAGGPEIQSAQPMQKEPEKMSAVMQPEADAWQDLTPAETEADTWQDLTPAETEIPQAMPSQSALMEEAPNTALQEESAVMQPLPEAQQFPEAGPGGIQVTDTLMDALLKNSPDSAGQIGRSAPGDKAGRMRDAQNMNAVLNQDGNLREKLTMFYNGVLLNGGRTQKETGSSISLKRLLRDVTRKQAAQKEGLSGLNMDAIEHDRSIYSDMFDPDRLQSKFGKLSIKDRISAFFGRHARRKNEKKPEGPEPGLGYAYYKAHGIKPSKRERAHAVEKAKDGTKHLKWEEGGAHWRIDGDSMWAKAMTEKGRILTAGVSGTTQRLLSAYRFLGASDKELFDFRLTMIGWMLTSQDHSLYEIMMGAQSVGVKGQENISEAAEMYKTVYPLSVDKLRSEVAKDKEFPHERVFKYMLREVARKRVAASKTRLKNKDGSLATLDPDNQTAQELALNIYTTSAFRTMTPSQKYGAKTGKKRMMALRNWKEGSYVGSEDDEKNGVSDELYQEIFEVIQIATRLGYEGLKEAAEKPRNSPEDRGTAPEGKLGQTAYKGTVYRGEGVSIFSRKYNKVGNIVTFPALTSTSKLMCNAQKFRDDIQGRMSRPVLTTIILTGKSGVDISAISDIPLELEVLVPGGAQFRVSKALTPDPVEKNTVTLEEVGGDDSYLRQLSEKGVGTESGMPGVSPAEAQDELLEQEAQPSPQPLEDGMVEIDLNGDDTTDSMNMNNQALGKDEIEKLSTTMQLAMSGIGMTASSALDEFSALGIDLGDDSNVPLMVEWYLGCAPSGEASEILTKPDSEAKEELIESIGFLVGSHGNKLKKLKHI